MHTAQKVREQLRGRRLAAALLCALLAAVTVAVEPPGQPAGAASDQSGGSQDPPAAPTTSAPAEISVGSLSRLRASLSGGSVSLSWWAPENNSAISKYQYQIKTMGAGGDYGEWTDISGSGASTTGGTISNVAGSERRNVRVRAVNAAGASLYYGVASTDVSDAPSGLRASLAGGSVSLSWDDPDDDFIDSYWYRIKKAGAGNAYSDLVEIADSGASTTSATISVTGQGRRIVELQARPAVHPGWGAIYKSAAASTGPPDAPSTLSASLSGSAVSLSWNNPSDAAITKYQYRIKTMGVDSDYGVWTDIGGSSASTTRATITVTGSGRRNVHLRAVNAEGSGGHAVASTGVPSVPSRLKAVLVSGGSVVLSWDDPGDDSIGSYQYRIRNISTGSAYGNWTDIGSSNASTTGHTLAVTGSGRRVVQLRARNSGGPGSPASASNGPPAQMSGFTTPGGQAWGVEGGISGLTAAATSTKRTIVVNWSDPGDDSIIKYQYRFRAQSIRVGGYHRPVDIPGSGPSTTSHTFVLPTPEMYRVVMWAINSAGQGHGVNVNMRPVWPALAAPSGLSASLSGNSVSLSWDNPFDGSIYKYQYRLKTVGAASTYSSWTDLSGSNADTTSATVTVTGSERRIVQLRALRRSLGDPSSPATASTGPPARPDPSKFSTSDGAVAAGEYNVLNALASSPKGSIVVNWVAPGDDSILKYQYRFRAQSRPESYSQWIDIPGSGASTTTHTFVFPTPEMHRVRLRAVNSAGPGGVTTFNMKPAWPALAVPSGLSASLSGNSVSLSWDNPFDGSIYKYQYRIKKVGAASAYSSWTDIASSNADTTSATVTVTGSERRIVQLRALRRSLGDPSSPATASTGPPAQPSGFASPGGSSSGSGSGIVLTAATSSSKGSVGVSWSAPGDDSILKYQYQFKAPNVLEDSQWIDIPGSEASTTTHTFVFPTPDMYRIRLRAVNSAGAASQTFNVKPSWPALAAPSGLGAVLNGSSVTLSWDKSFDHSIEKYQYRIKTVGAGNVYGSWTDIADSNNSTASHTISVTGSGQRDVQLRALRYDQVGGLGASATALTTAPPVTPAPTPLLAPGTPSNLRASGGNGVIDLFWSDPGDATINGYQYQILPPSERSFGEWQSIPGSGASTTKHRISGLVVNNGYGIRLRAGNAAGWGRYRGTGATTGLTHSPSRVVVTSGDGSFTVTWDAPEASYGITGYRYAYTRVADPKSWTGWLSLPGSARSHTVTGLTNGSQYEILLKAVSAAGESAFLTRYATPTAATSPSG